MSEIQKEIGGVSFFSESRNSELQLNDNVIVTILPMAPPYVSRGDSVETNFTYNRSRVRDVGKKAAGEISGFIPATGNRVACIVRLVTGIYISCWSSEISKNEIYATYTTLRDRPLLPKISPRS